MGANIFNDMMCGFVKFLYICNVKHAVLLWLVISGSVQSGHVWLIKTE